MISFIEILLGTIVIILTFAGFGALFVLLMVGLVVEWPKRLGWIGYVVVGYIVHYTGLILLFTFIIWLMVNGSLWMETL